VPECEFPPLRYETGSGAPCFPHGTFIGTWPGVELRAAVDSGVELLAVLQVRQFVIRDEFPMFAQALLDLRKGSSEYVQKAAKGIAVQTVGCWAAKPSYYRTHAGAWTEDPEGVTQIRPYLYQVPRSVPKYSDREILPANLTVAGIVRAWLGKLLQFLQAYGCKPLWGHTDGCATLNDPTLAVQRLLQHDARKATMHGFAQGALAKLATPAGIAELYAAGLDDAHIETLRRKLCSVTAPLRLPPPDSWKVYPLVKTEVYSATRRISTDTEGRERVAAGGISRNLGADEVRRLMRAEGDPMTRHRSWVSRRPVHATGWTRAPHVREIDAQHSRAVDRIWDRRHGDDNEESV
jgi:hypothetical protein